MPEGWREVSSVSMDLSLAVRLTDGVVGGRPSGMQTVRIEESDEEPIQNASGYYLFFDLPATSLTLTVDGGTQYQDVSTSVDLDPTGGARDPGEPKEVTLEPTTAYEFPPGLTRVRGTVRDDSGPVAGATVLVTDHTRSVETSADGEFVYYFDSVTQADVVRHDPNPKDPANPVERRYKPKGSHPEFVVDGDPGTFSESVVVEVGTLTTHDLVYP